MTDLSLDLKIIQYIAGCFLISEQARLFLQIALKLTISFQAAQNCQEFTSWCNHMISRKMARKANKPFFFEIVGRWGGPRDGPRDGPPSRERREFGSSRPPQSQSRW